MGPFAAPRDPIAVDSVALALPDRRAIAVGVVLAEGLVAVPLVARAAYGVLKPHQVVIGLLFTLFVLGVVMSSMTAAFRAALVRTRDERRALVAACATGALTSAVACLPWLPIMRRFPTAFQMLPGEPTTISYFLLTGITDSLIISLLWAAVFLYPSAMRAVRDRERELFEARTEAELLRLRSHLEPHFVLNTLNAIAAMVVDEPRAARTMLGALGDLFRDATADRSSEHHTLAREVEWLERYAAIVRGRFGDDGLRFECAVDEDARGLELPRLLLQPIVENAIQHGALRRDGGGGHVSLRAFADGDALVCEVRDNGPGPSGAQRRPGARGLAIVERRLALEAPGSKLTLDPHPDGGAIAVLRITQRKEQPR